MMVQKECIRDIEAILPEKANISDVKNEINEALLQKANLSDVKRTISEVAANIEQRMTFTEIKRLLDVKVDQNEQKAVLYWGRYMGTGVSSNEEAH